MLTTHRVLAVGTIVIAAAAGCGSNSNGGTFAPATLIASIPSPTPLPGATPVPSAAPTASPAPTAGPTATPSPVPTATPNPAAVIQASPASFAFTSVGAIAAQPLAATETGYAGAFSETDTCSAIATISPVSVPNGTPFTVTPVATGACIITLHDAGTTTNAVSVTITTSGLVVQKVGHR